MVKTLMKFPAKRFGGSQEHGPCLPRAGALMLLAAGLSLSGWAQPFELLSPVAPILGSPVGGGGDSYVTAISADGRYVLFSSTANNLVALSNGIPIPARIPAPLNAFVRDRLNQTSVLASLASSGLAGGDGDSFPISISTNGQYLLFTSSASNLVPGDSNNAPDVFVRDLLNNRKRHAEPQLTSG